MIPGGLLDIVKIKAVRHLSGTKNRALFPSLVSYPVGLELRNCMSAGEIY